MSRGLGLRQFTDKPTKTQSSLFRTAGCLLELRVVLGEACYDEHCPLIAGPCIYIYLFSTQSASATIREVEQFVLEPEFLQLSSARHSHLLYRSRQLIKWWMVLVVCHSKPSAIMPNSTQSRHSCVNTTRSGILTAHTTISHQSHYFS